jgi:hypothetical protein
MSNIINIYRLHTTQAYDKRNVVECMENVHMDFRILCRNNTDIVIAWTYSTSNCSHKSMVEYTDLFQLLGDDPLDI